MAGCEVSIVLNFIDAGTIDDGIGQRPVTAYEKSGDYDCDNGAFDIFGTSHHYGYTFHPLTNHFALSHHPSVSLHARLTA